MSADEMKVEEAGKEKAQQEAAGVDGGAKKSRPPLPPASFSTFVQGLAGQCLILLGALENPVTGKKEVDLEQAKYTVDLLDVLETKTRGNLDEEEQRLIRSLLYDLRMRYVQACR
ncbi:MAG TPA: DUF1844 domain-containing protein [Anaerolineae bacterium]|nr:DUF1844 domain-containing protein [Anaerolineae bacterium]